MSKVQIRKFMQAQMQIWHLTMLEVVFILVKSDGY